MFFSPALCAALQPLHLQNGLPQFLAEPLDLLQQGALPPADVLQLRALLWAQVYWDWGQEELMNIMVTAAASDAQNQVSDMSEVRH